MHIHVHVHAQTTNSLSTHVPSQLFKINTVAQVPKRMVHTAVSPMQHSQIKLLMCSPQTFEAAFSLDCRIPLHAYPDLCVRRCRAVMRTLASHTYPHIYVTRTHTQTRARVCPHHARTPPTHPHIHITHTHPRRPSWEVGELTSEEEEKLIPITPGGWP